MKIFQRIVAIVLIWTLSSPIHAQNVRTLNVGVLLPFYHDTSSTMSQKQISQAALDYYAGLRLAAEDLNAWNIGINLRVWDMQKMSDEDLIKLPKSKEFLALDVFLGPIAQKPVDLISTNLQNSNFLWVSPLTSLKLPKLVPNLNFFAHDSIRVKGLIGEIKRKYPKHSIHLISDKKEISLLSYYKKELKKSKIPFSEHQINGSKLSPKIASDKDNIILLNVGTSSFSRIGQYANISRRFDSYIVGDFSWYEDAATAEEIDESKIIYPSMNYINGADSQVLRFTHAFIQRERAEPSKFAFQAYDQLFFLGAHFASNGNLNLDEVPKASYSGLINTIEMKKSDKFTYVNQGIRLIKYDKIEIAEIEKTDTQK